MGDKDRRSRKKQLARPSLTHYQSLHCRFAINRSSLPGHRDGTLRWRGKEGLIEMEEERKNMNEVCWFIAIFSFINSITNQNLIGEDSKG